MYCMQAQSLTVKKSAIHVYLASSSTMNFSLNYLNGNKCYSGIAMICSLFKNEVKRISGLTRSILPGLLGL